MMAVELHKNFQREVAKLAKLYEVFEVFPFGFTKSLIPGKVELRLLRLFANLLLLTLPNDA